MGSEMCIRDRDGDRLILSPADGRIIAVGVPDGGPLGSRGKRVSIFMSPLDVHVNRAPVAGVVRRVEHRSGRFFSAFKPRAERENERTIVILDSPYGRTALSQVAGFLARRIVFHPREGDRLVSGQRIGMIRFGSRVDLFLPDNVTLDARLGRRTVAGETILGVFNDD